MSSKRNRQLAVAQEDYRKRKRETGHLRLQAWIAKDVMDTLIDLKSGLGLSQAKVIELAIEKLMNEQQTPSKEVSR